MAGHGSDSAAWPSGIEAITLFVEDLDAAKTFYGDVFGLPVSYEDDASAVFRFGETMVNLLKVEAAHELIAPADVGQRLRIALPVHDPRSTTWTRRASSSRRGASSC